MEFYPKQQPSGQYTTTGIFFPVDTKTGSTEKPYFKCQDDQDEDAIVRALPGIIMAIVWIWLQRRLFG